MAKKLQNSTKAKSKAREEDCYSHPESRERVYYSEEMVRQIGEQMVTYFKTNPKAIKIKQYLVEKSIYAGTWEKWLQKYEFLREQQQYCKDIIGTRRELGMVFLEMGQRETPNAKVMHIYDPDWVEIDKYHAELKAAASLKAAQDAGGSPGDTKIYLEMKTPRGDITYEESIKETKEEIAE